MKRFNFHLIICCLLISGSVMSQESGVGLENLTLPSSPAATIMGEQPIEVTRPKNMSQLESSLLSSFSDGANLILPDGLALEFMPYWLRPRAEAVYNRADDERHQWRPLENFAVSLATINRMQGDTLFRSQVGLGFRTILLNGRMSIEDLNKLDALKNDYLKASQLRTVMGGVIADLNGVVAGTAVNKTVLADSLQSKIARQCTILTLSELSREILVNWALNELDVLMPTEASAPQTMAALAQHLAPALAAAALATPRAVKTVSQIAKESQELRVKRYGWRWEIAGATYLDFPTQEISFSKIPKLGIWTNVSYTVPSGKVYFIFLGRYIHDFQFVHDEGDGVGAHNLDAGLSLVWDIGKFSITGEGIGRIVQYKVTETLEDGWERSKDESQLDYRVALNLSYRISEKVLVSYSFGKAFNTQGPNTSPLINQLSLNLGFGDVPLKL